MRKIIFVSAVLVVVALASCKKDTYDAGKTSAEKVSNNWWVTLSLDGQDLLGTSVLLTTYNTADNTADNTDSIWVDDLTNIWPFKCKAKVDNTNLTFQTDNSQSQYTDITVKLANGKVLPGAGHSKSGVVTDSIYMEATFSDDPGSTYMISGTARTGLVEDDY